MQDLKQFDSIPFNHSALLSLLNTYKYPNDKISKLILNGDIIKLKKGLYVNSQKYRNSLLSKELISNLIYGPSYISFDMALSYYNLIPEKVLVCRALTTKRSKNFNTKLGLFQYTFSEDAYYSIGITKNNNNNNHFLIACPAKALCDKIIFTKNLLLNSQKATRNFLLNDLRINEENLKIIDLTIIEHCLINKRKRRQLNFLIKTIEKLLS